MSGHLFLILKKTTEKSGESVSSDYSGAKMPFTPSNLRYSSDYKTVCQLFSVPGLSRGLCKLLIDVLNVLVVLALLIINYNRFSQDDILHSYGWLNNLPCVRQ